MHRPQYQGGLGLLDKGKGGGAFVPSCVAGLLPLPSGRPGLLGGGGGAAFL